MARKVPKLPKLPPFPPPLMLPEFRQGGVGFIWDKDEKCWWKVRILDEAVVTGTVKTDIASGALSSIYTAKVLEGKKRGKVVTLKKEDLKSWDEKNEAQSAEDAARCWQTENLRLTRKEKVHEISRTAEQKEAERLAKWNQRAFGK